MIKELLTEGAANAQTAKSLAAILGVTPRDISAQIEKERREGVPICASCDSTNPGYYLARTKQDLIDYCGVLQHRIKEIAITKNLMIKLATDLPDTEA